MRKKRKKGIPSIIFYPLLITAFLGGNWYVYKHHTKEAFDKLLSGLSGQSVHVNNRYANRSKDYNFRNHSRDHSTGSQTREDTTDTDRVSTSLGIHEVVANELKQREDWNEEAMKNLMDAFFIENKYEFSATNSSDLAMMRFEALLGSIANMNIIQDVDKTPTNFLHETYMPLKEVLIGLNEIYNTESTNTPPSIRISKIYEMIAENRRVTYSKRLDDFTHVEKVVDSKVARSHHLCSAYYSLMTYYNIPVSMRFSHIRQGNKDLGPHAWLTISSDTATYDLDPSIYKRFVPLVERDPDLEITTLKEEYIVKKRIILKK